MFPSLGNRLLELARIPHSVTVLNVQCGYGDSADSIEHLDFGDETFDAVLCACTPFGYSPVVVSELREWRRVAKTGGTVGFTSYGENAFQPLAELFEVRIQRYGAEFAAPIRSLAWRRLSNSEACRDLLRDAGFENIEVRAEQLGYYLKDAGEWWDIVWDSGFRGLLLQLPLDQLAQFKTEHLVEISALATTKGIWLDVSTIFAVGQKPS